MILWRAKGPDGVEGTCPITARYVCTGLEYDIKVTGDKGRFDVVFAFRDEADLAANVHLSGLPGGTGRCEQGRGHSPQLPEEVVPRHRQAPGCPRGCGGLCRWHQPLGTSSRPRPREVARKSWKVTGEPAARQRGEPSQGRDFPPAIFSKSICQNFSSPGPGCRKTRVS